MEDVFVTLFVRGANLCNWQALEEGPQVERLKHSPRFVPFTCLCVFVCLSK